MPSVNIDEKSQYITFLLKITRMSLAVMKTVRRKNNSEYLRTQKHSLKV